jgi:hypothetical protein
MSHKIPSMYLKSKLFPKGKLSKQEDKVPDPQDETLLKFNAISIKNNEAVKALNGLLDKAMMQESSGRHSFISEGQAKRESESDKTLSGGEGNADTPDLPERGSDWHGVVPGAKPVPKDGAVDIGKTPEEQDQVRKEERKGKHEEALKSLAGAPQFSPGPFVPHREQEFLLQYGYTPEEIAEGNFKIAPWIRAEFNRQQMKSIKKSIDSINRMR